VVLYFLSKAERPILTDLVVTFSQENTRICGCLCVLPDFAWFSVVSFLAPKSCARTKKSEWQSGCRFGVCHCSNNCSLQTQTNANAESLYPSLLHACRRTALGLCIGRRREHVEQFRIFDNAVLAATVCDCFTLRSCDPSAHSPSAFCTVGTENGMVFLGCDTESYFKKMCIQPYLLCGAISSTHEMERRKQLCNISRASFAGYNLSLKFSHLVKMLLGYY